MNDVLLEDIYTPIDRCLADGVALRSQSPADLERIRSQIEFLIALAIDRCFRRTSNRAKQYVRDFARVVTEIASRRADLAAGTNCADAAKQYDPLSIISLNWDILLDHCLHQELARRDGGLTGDYDPVGVVDYCCYISSLAARERRIRPGLWTLGARGYNLKLLKIHGSMNWLQCSNCQRLFIAFDGKLNIPNFLNPGLCRHCRKYGVRARLRGALVMPTFLKDLSNFQLKLVWQNAGVELMEASRIVFIGYSLPHADFEFRQLLSRMVQRTAAIHVVLFRGSSADGRRRYNEECSRYRQFFSGQRLSFEPRGVLHFVEELVSRRGVR